MGTTCSTNWEKRNACRILVGKPEGKRPLGRRRRRWVNNIKMDLGEIGWGGVVWTGLILLRILTVKDSCEHGNEPSDSIKYWEVFE
jgi:hypothetical protein